MNKIFMCVIALMSIVATLCAVETYEHKIVGKIELILNTKTNVQAIRERMKVKEGLPFSQNDFDEDLKMLSQEYEEVVPKLSISGETLIINLKIVPKRVIKEISFEGNVAYAQRKLKDELTISSGALFDSTNFSQSIQKIKAFYIKRGYFEISIEPCVTSNNDGTVSLKLMIKEGRPGTIDKIIFKNFTKKEQEDLQDLLQTKEYFILTSWATGDGIHKPEVWRYDETTILNFLHNEGYADAKITTNIKETKNKKRIIIEVTAQKGEIYRFGNISIEGNTLFTSEDLLKIGSCRKGDLFSPEKMHNFAKTISEKYGRKGYVDAVCSPEQQMKFKEKTFDVRFVVEEGRCYRVGIIKVLGNVRTHASVILHESLMIPGEIFDATLLGKTEERLKNTRYFTSVNVYAVKPKEKEGPAAAFRDVIIEVQEENSTTAHFKGSIGYSTTERFVGSVGVSESNFNILGFKDVPTKGMKALRGAGEYCSLDLTFGSRSRAYTLAWSKPYFMDTKWTIGTDLQRIRNSYASSQYTIKTNLAYFYASYPINAFVMGTTHYRIAKSKVALKHIKNTKRNRELIKESEHDGIISGIGGDLMYDSRDLPIAATKGLHSQIGLEYVGLGGNYTFAKANYLNSLYYSPYKGATITLRGDLQFIKAFGDTHRTEVPLNERLYSGGETTLRGFGYHMVGPKFKDKFRTPRGGFSEILLSAEYTQQLFKKLDGFVFLDTGNAYFEQFHVGTLRTTLGFGLKIKFKENGAPIVVGLGYPLNPENRGDVKHFFLSMGTSF